MSTTTFKHQVIFYFLCGALSTSCDFAIYYLLYHNDVQLDIAKGSSFLIATFISYFLNKYITFKTLNRSFMEFTNFVVVHLVSMVIDVGTNRLFLLLLSYFIVGQNKFFLSFVLATGCSVTSNFIGQKFWVFKSRSPAKAICI